MRPNKRTALVFLLSFILTCAALGTAMENTFAQEPLALAEDARLEILGAGISLSLGQQELLARPLETFRCKHISSSGEVYEAEVTGFALEGLLAEHGLDMDKIAFLNFIASDGYVMGAPAEIWAEHGVYIMLVRDGQGLEYPRSCIPEQRSMYWVKNLATIELVPTEELALQLQAQVKRITFFREAVSGLEPTELSNRGYMVKAYFLQAYFEEFAVVPEAPVTMLARDGFEKTETPDVFLSGFVTLEAEPGREGDLPLYFSEEMSLGMRVKQLDLVISGEDAVYFGSEVPVAELFSRVGMQNADTYLFTASDGFTVEIPAAAIPYGVIYPDEKAGYLRVKFDGYDLSEVKGGGKVKYLAAIAVVE